MNGEAVFVARLTDEAHRAGTLSLLFNGKTVTFDELTVKRLD